MDLLMQNKYRKSKNKLYVVSERIARVRNWKSEREREGKI